jgi:hypothetical protein
MFKKLQQGDVFRNRMVAHPKANFFVNSGSVTYNNNVPSVLSAIQGGQIALGDLVHPLEDPMIHLPPAPSFGGGPISDTDLLSIMRDLVSYDDSSGPQTGDALTVATSASAPYDFLIQDANEVVSSYTDSDYFMSGTQDSRCALLCFKGDLTINAGQVFQSVERKPFTVIYVGGDLIVSGAVVAVGADHSAATGANLTPLALRIATGTFSAITNPEIPAVGGAGGVLVGAGDGTPGSPGTGGSTGGGGAGSGNAAGSDSGDGAPGTGYTGGTGGGSSANGTTATDGAIDGGLGGDANSTSGAAGGGAGNPGGGGLNGGADGDTGTGGCLIIFVEGTYSGTGTISTDGFAGGTGNQAGGSSAGGSVTIICNIDSGPTPTAAGGPSTVGGNRDGGAGGLGTARVLTGI